jgi:hypothetical protein
MLVTAETAISLVLLAGSGLLIRSFVETMRAAGIRSASRPDVAAGNVGGGISAG